MQENVLARVQNAATPTHGGPTLGQFRGPVVRDVDGTKSYEGESRLNIEKIGFDFTTRVQRKVIHNV